MPDGKRILPRRVLIASTNPLFDRGLQKLMEERSGSQSLLFRTTSNMKETVQALEDWQPDLVVVDYDDQAINRSEFLTYFVSGDQPMQVMLVSLQADGEVVIYDRRTLTTAQAADWLDFHGYASPTFQGKKELRKGRDMKHFVIASTLVILGTIVFYALLRVIGLLPTEASLQAVSIDRLFNVHFLLISFFFSLVVVFLIYSLVVFRRKPGQIEVGKHITGSTPLEITWTVIPLGIVLILSYLGSVSLAEIRRIDPQAMVVKVTAGQWFWKFEYPDYGITSSTLYLPVNRQVLLKMTSVDVIHSFWVPEFRVKQDVLPGANLVKELRITPTKIGSYTVMCAELCGGKHAEMTSPVIIVNQTDFDQWVKTESTAMNDPVGRGQKYIKENGCTGCHSIDGSKLVGPTFMGLFGHSVQLADGASVTADQNYLKESILEPNAKIVKGFPPNIMPKNYGQALTEDQVNDIIAFLESIK